MLSAYRQQTDVWTDVHLSVDNHLNMTEWMELRTAQRKQQINTSIPTLEEISIRRYI